MNGEVDPNPLPAPEEPPANSTGAASSASPPSTPLAPHPDPEAPPARDRTPSHPLGQRPNSRPNPFIGPRAFQPGESLYGRERETAQLLNQVIADRVVLLYSPSGAGKTSLINASLLPRLKARRFTILPTLRLNLEPPAALAGEPGFNRYVFSALTCLDESLPAAERLPEAELAALSLAQYLERRPAGTTALVFDQFEEILTLDPTDIAAKQAFFEQAGEVLADRSRWALFSMREDYLAGLDPYTLPLPTRLSSTFRLDLLDKDAAGEVLQRTSASQGVEFVPEAAQRLLDDLSRVQVQRLDGSVDIQYGRYIEPVQLQVVCRSIWERLSPDDPRISLADIEAVGDVDRSLAEYYALEVQLAAGFAVQQAALTGRALTAQGAEREVREWFDHALITENGLRSQVLMGAGSSQGLANPVIYQLVDAHLVRAEKRRGVNWFELAHDRLIRPVRDDNAAWFLANLSLLQRQAGLWDRQDRPDHLLLRGESLQQAEDWAEVHPLTPVEASFLEACRDIRRQEDQARQAQAQAIQLAEQRRQARRLQFLLGLALLAALVATGFGITAYYARQAADLAADANATYAAQNELIAATAQYFSTQAVAGQATAVVAAGQAEQARALAESERQAADIARLAAEKASQDAEQARLAEAQQRILAEARAQQAQAQAALAASRQLAAQASSYLTTQPELSALLAVEAYTTSQTAQARSMLLSVIQTGLQQTFRQQDVQPGLQGADIFRVALSPDGRWLAWADESIVTLWDLRLGRVANRHSRHAENQFGQIHGLVFSPDSRYLLSGDYGGLLAIWDIERNTVRAIPREVSSIADLAFSPDGTRLAAAVGTQVTIWNWPNLDGRLDLRGGNWDFINAIAWSPDGARLASGGDDRRVVIWSTDSGVRNTVLTGHQSKPGEPGVTDLDWSAQNALVSGAGDGSIIIWDLLGGKIGKQLAGVHDGKSVNSLAFSRDGSLLASGGGDAMIRLFTWPDLTEISRLENYHTRTVSSLVFSPSGANLLASGGFDNRVGLHRIQPIQPLAQTLLAVPDPILAIEALGDGALRFVRRSGRGSAGLWLWDGAAASQVMLKLPALDIAALGGQRLAIAEADGPLVLYDLNSGQEIGGLDPPAGRASALALAADGQSLAAARCLPAEGQTLGCVRRQIWLWPGLSDPAAAEPYLFLDIGPAEAPTYTLKRPSILFHSGEVQALAFDPLKPVLGTSGDGGMILQWLLENGQSAGLPMQRGNLPVLSLAYNPTGGILASGEASSHLVLWDLETLQPLGAPLEAAGAPLLSLAFDPEGRQLFSGDEAGNLLVWDLDPASWLQRACETARRNLTQAEWRTFFPGQAYRRTCPQWPAGS